MDLLLPPGVIAICCPRKIKPEYCEIILNVMGDVSRITGKYAYDNTGKMTLLYIDPEDSSYIDSEMKYLEATKLFVDSMVRVTQKVGNISWE